MHLLISGSSGFIGSNFRSYIMQFPEYTFRNLSRNKITNKKDEVSCDLIEGIPDDIKVIFHFAGIAHDTKNSIDVNSYFDVNTRSSIYLFNAFLASKATKFIFMSSVKAAADNLTGILTEEAFCEPKTAYGQSKYQAECEMQKLLLEYNSLNSSQSKSLFILRPCMIHGPMNKGNLNLLFKVVSKNIPWPLGAFKNQRSFCSIDNLMFIFKEIIERNDIPSGIYNIADDEPLSTNEIIELIAKSQNRNPKIWKISKELIEWISKIGDILHLPLNTIRLQKLTSSYLVSNDKIKNAIGKPLPISSREGLLKTFKYFGKQ